MKSKFNFACVVFIIFPLIFLGQKSKDSLTQQLKTLEFGIQSGIIRERANADITREELWELMQPTTLFPLSYKDSLFSYYGAFPAGGYVTFQLGIPLGIHRTNPLLRIGFGYCNRRFQTGGTFFERKVRYDTLYSSQTNSPLYVDSLYMENYFVDHISNYLPVEIFLLLRSKQETRWSVAVGLGISSKVSIKARTKIHYFPDVQSVLTDTAGEEVYSGLSGWGYYDAVENIKTKPNWGVTFAAPFTVDLRLAKENLFWKRVYFFYEIRGILTLSGIPEIGRISSYGVTHGFGLRMRGN